eukprot:5119252-Alexandrium_andersonii.AAC.1
MKASSVQWKSARHCSQHALPRQSCICAPGVDVRGTRTSPQLARNESTRAGASVIIVASVSC